MMNAFSITGIQDDRTLAWHGIHSEVKADGVTAMTVAQHRANFDLWHEEDKARAPDDAATLLEAER